MLRNTNTINLRHKKKNRKRERMRETEIIPKRLLNPRARTRQVDNWNDILYIGGGSNLTDLCIFIRTERVCLIIGTYLLWIGSTCTCELVPQVRRPFYSLFFSGSLLNELWKEGPDCLKPKNGRVTPRARYEMMTKLILSILDSSYTLYVYACVRKIFSRGGARLKIFIS